MKWLVCSDQTLWYFGLSREIDVDQTKKDDDDDYWWWLGVIGLIIISKSMVVAFSGLGEDHGCEKRWRKMELHDVLGRQWKSLGSWVGVSIVKLSAALNIFFS